jgi:O-antigen/teichoic acid export membrane protein
MRLIKLPSSLKNMLTYAVSLFMAKGISLIMLPFVARYLSPDQLGQLELLATTTVFFSLLVGFAMHENLYRFVGEIKDTVKQFKKVSELYTYAIILSIMAGSLVTIGLFITPSIQGIFSSTDIALVCIVLAFESALGISTAWLRFQDRATMFFAVSMLSTAIQIIGVVAVLLFSPTVTHIFAVGVLTAIVQLIVLHRVNRFQWRWAGVKNLLSLLSYSIPLMLSAIVAFGLSGAEKWIIGYSVSVESLGYYAVAAKFSLGMCILVQPFGMWWMPKRFNALNLKGIDYTTQITQIGILYIAILAIVVGSASQVFIMLALPDAFSNAANLVSGVIAVALFKELAELVNIGILNHKKTHWVLNINMACTLTGLALCGFLSLQDRFTGLGIWAVIISIMIAQILRAILLLTFSQRLQPLPYHNHALLLIMLNTIGCLILSFVTDKTFWLILVALFGTILNMAIAYRFRFFSSLGLPTLKLPFQKQTQGA